MLPHHLTEIGTLGLMAFTVASVVWRATRDEPAVPLPAADAEPGSSSAAGHPASPRHLTSLT